MKIQFQKIRDVKSPSRGTKESAGIDCYLPKDFITEPTIIKPGESVFAPSGLKVRIPHGYALIAFNKSGIALKQGLSVGASVVDSDYDQEVHLHVINISCKDQIILPEQKLVQFILVPICLADIEEINELPERQTDRTGGFGSTGL